MPNKKVRKTVILDILTKLGKEYSSKISEKRAEEKLERAIDEEGGLPENVELIDTEIKLLETMGYELGEEDFTDEELEPNEDNLEEIDEDEYYGEEEEEEEPEEEDEDFEEVEEDEDFEEEEEKPKKEKKQTAKITKNSAICTVLKKKKKWTLQSLAKAADEFYVKNGGKSNIDGTIKYCVGICTTLQDWGAIERTGDNIKVL